MQDPPDQVRPKALLLIPVRQGHKVKAKNEALSREIRSQETLSQ
jgi:hypothetical protein